MTRLKDHLTHFANPLPVYIEADEPDASGASHNYYLYRSDAPGAEKPGSRAGTLHFQKGPRGEEGSTEGLSDAAVIVVVLDRYRGFQQGLYACKENDLVIAALEDALKHMAWRQNDRHSRGVLGTNAA